MGLKTYLAKCRCTIRYTSAEPFGDHRPDVMLVMSTTHHWVLRYVHHWVVMFSIMKLKTNYFYMIRWVESLHSPYFRFLTRTHHCITNQSTIFLLLATQASYMRGNGLILISSITLAQDIGRCHVFEFLVVRHACFLTMFSFIFLNQW